MPTQLDNTRLPGEAKEINSDMLGGLSKTHEVTKEVSRIIEHLSDKMYRGLQSIPVFKIIQDHHSDLTSDDLLWYIKRGLSEEEIILLKNIKFSGDSGSMAIPRDFSKEIKAENDQAFTGKKNWKFFDNFREHERLKLDTDSFNNKYYGSIPFDGRQV